jgi:hypothetical protein
MTARCWPDNSDKITRQLKGNTMDIRSPLLNSNIARDAIAGSGLNDLAVTDALAAIDKLGNLHDALHEAQKSIDPAETAEARAMRYEAQFTRAVERGRDVATAVMGRLMTTAAEIEARGIEAAGLASEPRSAAEIRAALRSMSPAEREKAISRAFETRDSEVLASIYNASGVTWGGTKAPVGERFRVYIDEVSPETVVQRQAADSLMQSLELAAEAFTKAAKKWRDPIAAERGRQQQEHHQRADRALKDALA